ncbi:hypothetical protein [Desulfoglaeba alkanexedens]|uniref:hypothetical protein n=1 Tax=Desulfoglaeba alkanexedens TaxID=361111 RepID=UPI001FE7337B|nr:hypothetical protein [Desulfoglaeba alkanexedens]
MGGYDAAMKIILAHCREAALEFFLGLHVEESEILELPQETASVRRSDFPIRVRASDGRVFIVLLEVQSRWEPNVPLRLLERRRDIMMESYAYELIKKEGYKEGVRLGIEQGLRQGIEQGLQQGTLEATREHIMETSVWKAVSWLSQRHPRVPPGTARRVVKVSRPCVYALLKEVTHVSQRMHVHTRYHYRLGRTHVQRGQSHEGERHSHPARPEKRPACWCAQ